MSFEDVELQIAYLLFILGQHASPTLGFYHTYQRPYPPYRPFGVRASIALICYAFMSIRAAEIGGYQFKEIWVRDQEFFSTMTSRLQKSPLFPAESQRTSCNRLSLAFKEPSSLKKSVLPPQSPKQSALEMAQTEWSTTGEHFCLWTRCYYREF